MMIRMMAMRSKALPAAIPAITGTENWFEGFDVADGDAVKVGVASVEAACIVVEATGGGVPVATAIAVSVMVYDVCTSEVDFASIVIDSEVL
jgi:hypothetical protein